MVGFRLGAFVPVAEPDFSRGVSSFGGESATFDRHPDESGIGAKYRGRETRAQCRNAATRAHDATSFHDSNDVANGPM
jgi:hypothetical protein